MLRKAELPDDDMSHQSEGKEFRTGKKNNHGIKKGLSVDDFLFRRAGSCLTNRIFDPGTKSKKMMGQRVEFCVNHLIVHGEHEGIA